MPSFIADNYTIIIITLGTMLLGLVNGVLGVFMTLKKQALVGDALSHATLPGVVLAFIFTQSKSMIVLLLGAAISAVAAMFILELIKRQSKIKYDAGLALILSGFFGFGQILLLVVQTSGSAASAGLNNFIFGQAATMLISDIEFIAIISLVVLFVIILLWKEFKLFIFNNEFYQSLGYSNRITTIIFNTLIVIVVTISIRTVGVILMSALLIAPAVAARQLSKKLVYNTLLAGLFGLVSGASGAIISSQVTNLATGPVIVVILCTIVLIALLFAPKRGVINKLIIDKIHQIQIRKYHNLIHAYQENGLLESSEDISGLLEKGYIEEKSNSYYLTDVGNKKVESIIGERK